MYNVQGSDILTLDLTFTCKRQIKWENVWNFVALLKNLNFIMGIVLIGDWFSTKTREIGKFNFQMGQVLGLRPSLYYVSKRTGWMGQKKARFTDVQYCIHADKVGGGLGQKRTKIYWCNVGMVPMETSSSQGLKKPPKISPSE